MVLRAMLKVYDLDLISFIVQKDSLILYAVTIVKPSHDSLSRIDVMLWILPIHFCALRSSTTFAPCACQSQC